MCTLAVNCIPSNAGALGDAGEKQSITMKIAILKKKKKWKKEQMEVWSSQPGVILVFQKFGLYQMICNNT